MYLKRTLENQILKASKAFPVVLISGPRQVAGRVGFRPPTIMQIAYESLLETNAKGCPILTSRDAILHVEPSGL